MVAFVYWGLDEYAMYVPAARGAQDGLVAQSRALFLRSWLPHADQGVNKSYAGRGGYVFENYGADTGEGYSSTGSAQPLYSWGGLLGYIGLVHNGF